ncbi:hypothetical protein Tco_1402763 [Tanacetum coccineum]
MNMLNRNCKTSFAKPEFLKKAQRANPRLYDIGCYNDNLALMLAPESDESIQLANKCRSKLSDLIRPFDYDQLNNLYDWSNSHLLELQTRLKSNHWKNRVVSNNSQEEAKKLEGHRRKTRHPMAVPISTRKPKQNVIQSVATSRNDLSHVLVAGKDLLFHSLQDSTTPKSNLLYGIKQHRLKHELPQNGVRFTSGSDPGPQMFDNWYLNARQFKSRSISQDNVFLKLLDTVTTSNELGGDKLVSWSSKSWMHFNVFSRSELKRVLLNYSVGMNTKLSGQFTKALSKDRFKYLVRRLGGQDMYEQGLLATVNVDKLAEDGGLDSLTLNSLYDEGAYRASQQPVDGSPTSHLFEAADPFGMSAPAGQMKLFQDNPLSV